MSLGIKNPSASGYNLWIKTQNFSMPLPLFEGGKIRWNASKKTKGNGAQSKVS